MGICIRPAVSNADSMAVIAISKMFIVGSVEGEY